MDRTSHELIVTTITEHAESLLRVARRHTRCQADAEDAYQRALEIFVKRAARLEPSTAHRWLHTVVKREAWAIGEARAKYVGVDDEEALDALDDGRHVATVEERSERFEELALAAEALKRLKPQEVTALVLKAQGLSYNEIAERQGWTYTKVNRAITEGRRAFLARYEGIRTGAECERWLDVLSAMADGEATSEQLVDARPHLRNCPGCRSVLGGMHRTAAPVAALLPSAILGDTGGSASGVLDRLGELVLGVQERIVAPMLKVQGSLEAVGSTKLAAVAASTVAIAGGGVAVERQADGGDARAAGRQKAEPVADAAADDPPRQSVATMPLKPAGAVTPPAVAPDPASHRRSVERSPAQGTVPDGAEFAAEAYAAEEPATEDPSPVAATASAVPGTSTAAAEEDATGGGTGGEFDIGS
jgi:RNA polymerase sigma factor (sigma-70 family)